MKKNLVSLVFLMYTFSALSQEKGQIVSGYVYDIENNTPLSGVNILIGGTQSGSTTNTEGYFNVKVKKFPVQLFFSYVGYEIKEYQVKSAETIRIFLKQEIREIGEVTISGERIIKLIKGDTLNIVDYEISDDQIIMIANPYKVLRDQRLYLTDRLVR